MAIQSCWGCCRFTPTGVGTTVQSSVSRVPSGRFTPTGVGTTFLAGWVNRDADGSPPRVWGQRSRCRSHAGCRTVHPHGCGDNGGNLPDRPRGQRFTPTGVGTTRGGPGIGRGSGGSPPRVWGQREGRRSVSCSATVHPHGCGDNVERPWLARSHHRFTPTGVGTTADRARWPVALLRFTPTGVGTTTRAAPLSAPRSRFTPTGVGTTDGRFWTAFDEVWFTPTGVGTT